MKAGTDLFTNMMPVFLAQIAQKTGDRFQRAMLRGPLNMFGQATHLEHSPVCRATRQGSKEAVAASQRPHAYGWAASPTVDSTVVATGKHDCFRDNTRQGSRPNRSCCLLGRFQRRMEDGVEQATKTMSEARLQPVAQRDQLIDPGDDAAFILRLPARGLEVTATTAVTAHDGPPPP